MLTKSATTLPRVGVGADHGGFELKEHLVGKVRAAGYEVIDFGDCRLDADDDYPDFVVPLARAVAGGQVERGVAICGSGVGATVAANKVAGVRACVIHDTFSAHQGVEDDDLNLMCLGGLVVGHALAWELVKTFLAARFSGADDIADAWPKSPPWKTPADEQVMKTSPFAGKPAEAGMLVNVPRLVTAYYTEAPDPAAPAQRVAFGTSGHRGSAFNSPSTRTTSWRSPKRSASIESNREPTARCFWAWTPTRCRSRPARPRWRCWRPMEWR